MEDKRRVLYGAYLTTLDDCVGRVLAAVEGEIRPVTLDELGRIEFSSAPEPGGQITAGFVFDVPVRFDTDRIDASMEAFEAGLVPQIPLADVWLSPGSAAP